MTRHDLLIRLNEIRAVVVTCKACKSEIHVNLDKLRDVHGACPVCNKVFGQGGDNNKQIENLVASLIECRKTAAVELGLAIPME